VTLPFRRGTLEILNMDEDLSCSKELDFSIEEHSNADSI